MTVITLNGVCFDESFVGINPENPHKAIAQISQSLIIEPNKLQLAVRVKETHQPYILFRKAFDTKHLTDTPSSFDPVDSDCWWLAANTAIALADKLELILEPGDIVFVNNRTAIHGRSKPQISEEGKGRWLMRSYGIQNETKVYPLSTDKPYLLTP